MVAMFGNVLSLLVMFPIWIVIAVYIHSKMERAADGTVILNREMMLVVSFFLGLLGIDRLLMGHKAIGFLKLLTLGGFVVGWVVDVIRIAAGGRFKNVTWED